MIADTAQMSFRAVRATYLYKSTRRASANATRTSICTGLSARLTSWPRETWCGVSDRPDGERIGAQNLCLGRIGKWQGADLVKILLDVWHTGTGEIGAKQRAVGDFLDARKIFEQQLRRDAADVEIDIFVAT